LKFVLVMATQSQLHLATEIGLLFLTELMLFGQINLFIYIALNLIFWYVVFSQHGFFKQVIKLINFF